MGLFTRKQNAEDVLLGKPASFGIHRYLQGSANLFVASIVGSPSNVIGLPLATVARLVEEVGSDLFSFSR